MKFPLNREMGSFKDILFTFGIILMIPEVFNDSKKFITDFQIS